MKIKLYVNKLSIDESSFRKALQSINQQTNARATARTDLAQ